MARLLFEAFARALDTGGDPISGAKLYVYEAGTTTPVDTYSDSSLSTVQSKPVLADAEGYFPQIYVPAGIYKITVKDANDATVQEHDDVNQYASDLFVDDVKAFFDSTDTYTAGTYVRTRAEGFAYKAVDTATATTVANAGGQNFEVLRGPNGYSWAQWGVSPGNPADTAAAQKAIDFILDSGEAELLAPAGHYVFGQLRLFDATKPGRAERGKMTLVGEGQLAYTEVYRGETVNAYYGTVIEINEATADGIILASGDGLQRASRLDNLSVIYGGSGYAIDARYIPNMEMDRVSIRVTSADGKAMNTGDVWGGRLRRVIAVVDVGVTSTAHGIKFSSTLFAGNWTIRDSLVDHFNDNFWFAPGSIFVNVIIQNAAAQKFNRYGIFVESPIENLILRDHYTETGSGTSTIKIDPSAGEVSNFSIDGLFILGGTKTEAWLTGPAIDMDNVSTYKFERVKYFRPWVSLVRHGVGVLSGTIDNIDVLHDQVSNLPAGPLYIISGAGGRGGTVAVSNSKTQNTPKIELFDKASDRVAQFDGTGTINNAISFGALGRAVLSAGFYNMNNEDPRPVVVKIVASGSQDSVLSLPAMASVNDTDIRWVFNDPGSTQGVVLKDHSNNNIGYTVAVGEGAICIADKPNGKWLVMAAAGAYGP